MKKQKTIVIIGGGITGLSTAYFLKEACKASRLHCILIESDTRWGGKIITEQSDHFVIEGGPDSFLSTKPGGMALCRALGLADQIVQTDPVHKSTFILSHGVLQKFPEGMNLMIPGQITPFLLTSLISWRGKARMGLDLLIPRRNAADDESIASFVRRRFGEEAVSLFAEPILATIYAGDAERLSLKATFPQFCQLEQEFGSLIWGVGMKKWDAHRTTPNKGQPPWTFFVTLRQGLKNLVSSLQNQLDHAALRLGQPVLECGPHPEGGYTIVLQDETLYADAVVITTDATGAARFIQPWDQTLAGELAAIPYVSTATVSLGFRREDVGHPLNGFGFVIPRSERKNILAVTWSSTKFNGRADSRHVLIRSFLGGAHHEENVVNSTLEELISKVHHELAPLLGIRAKPVTARAFKWIKANPQYNVGHLDRVAAIEKAVANHPGLFLAGAAYKGIGIPDCIAQGREAAEKAARFICDSTAFSPFR